MLLYLQEISDINSMQDGFDQLAQGDKKIGPRTIISYMNIFLMKSGAKRTRLGALEYT